MLTCFSSKRQSMKKFILVFGIILSGILPAQAQSSGDSDTRMKFPEFRPKDYTTCFFGLGGEYLRLKYDGFFPLLGSYNDSINSVTGTGRFETGVAVNRHYISATYGFTSLKYTTDSLQVYFNSRVYGLTYGYNVVDSWRWTVRPAVAVKWCRGRLINVTADDVIPLKEYLSGRDLDIRFNQPTGFAGIDVGYKSYVRKNLSAYYKFGIYAGYAFKLTYNPIVRSRSTRLRPSPDINLDPISFGMYISFNIDNAFR